MHADDTFEFEIPNHIGLHNVILTCKVRDDDVNTTDDKIGKCTINLSDVELTREPKALEKTISRSLFSKNAKIHLHLSYRA